MNLPESLLENWMQTPGARALAWTLIHSLWEGAIVALALAASLCVFRGSRARYTAACLALIVMLAGFGLTFANLMAREQTRSTRTGALRLAPVDLDAGPSPNIQAARGVAGYLPWIAPFWIAGVLIFHLRSLAGWMGARRLRRTGVCCPPAGWQELLERLAARLRIGAPVTLWESCLADVPLVIGFFRPVILMPVGLLAGLPAAQVEALLLHELAHIRRYDYLVNLLQVFVEGLVFYHPAVWWIAAVIRAERENCCDDVVVATQGDAYQYATALAALEFNRVDARQPALAATGGSLMKRIRRLLAQPETPRSALTPVLSAAILTVTVVAVLAAWQSKPPAPAPMPSSAVPRVPAAAPATPAPAAPRPLPAPLLAQAQETPAALPAASPYRKWLNEDVAYIISEQERAAFKNLRADEERDHFVEQFWLRRNPLSPTASENPYKEEHYRRIAYANEHFASAIAGWKTDRGRIYIVYGPPDEKESHPSGGQYKRPRHEGGGTTVTFPFEQWRYRFIEGIGKDVIVEFVDPTLTGEYRMTVDPSEKTALLSLPPVQNVATVQMLGGKAFISIPLRGYQGHSVILFGRILTRDGVLVSTFEDTVQGAAQGTAPNYLKIVPLALGEYRLELTGKDLTTGKTFNQTIEIQAR